MGEAGDELGQRVADELDRDQHEGDDQNLPRTSWTLRLRAARMPRCSISTTGRGQPEPDEDEDAGDEEGDQADDDQGDVDQVDRDQRPVVDHAGDLAQRGRPPSRGWVSEIATAPV